MQCSEYREEGGNNSAWGFGKSFWEADVFERWTEFYQSAAAILQREANNEHRIQNSLFLYDWETWKRKEENMEEGTERWRKERGKEKDYFFKTWVSEHGMEFSSTV